MRANRLHWLVGGGIFVLTALECLQAFPALPDPMASNFDGSGVPGGWSSKKTFMAIYAGSMAFWVIALLAAPFMAASSRHTLGEADRRWLRDRIGWFAVASGGLCAIVTHWVIEANLVTGRLSDGFVWLFGIYMAYMLWWTITLVRRVHRLGNSKSPTAP